MDKDDYIILDREPFVEFLKEKKVELERFGSIIFPLSEEGSMKLAKQTLKERLRVVKLWLKQIEERKKPNESTDNNNVPGV